MNSSSVDQYVASVSEFVPAASGCKGDIPYGLDAQCNVGNTVGISINYDMFKVGDGSTFATKDSALMTVGAVFKW